MACSCTACFSRHAWLCSRVTAKASSLLNERGHANMDTYINIPIGLELQESGGAGLAVGGRRAHGCCVSSTNGAL